MKGAPLYLSRYVEVMRDHLPSQFLISRSIGVDFSRDASLDELWRLHDNAMKLFYEKLNEITLEEISFAPSSLLDLKIAIANKILTACCFCERCC